MTAITIEQATEAKRDSQTVFALTDVRRTYVVGGESVHALDGVSLVIRERDFLAIIGSSGSGKSTLMHTLGFMDRPTCGELFFDGRDVSDIDNGTRAELRSSRIGFVFQSFNLLPKLTVLENVTLPLTYAKERKLNRRELGMTALERVGMQHRAKHRPNELSGGERQRVSIARALINTPRLVLADEPTGNLDSTNRERVMELFQELRREGITLALVTHDDAVAAYASRRVQMRDGKIVEDVDQ